MSQAGRVAANGLLVLLPQVNEAKCSIKFQLKKVLCMGVAIANVAMTEGEIRTNVSMAGLCLAHSAHI